MPKQSRDDTPRMSPLARALQAKQAEGVSYREMERIALRAGHDYTSSSFEQVAKDQRAGRLDVDALKAIATVLDLTVREVADLDDERWQIKRRHVVYDDPDPDLSNVSNERLLEELAKRTSRP